MTCGAAAFAERLTGLGCAAHILMSSLKAYSCLSVCRVAFAMDHWISRSPRVYRFLNREFVDEFFRTGHLRLSSFCRFSQHADEQRLDSQEGKAILIHVTNENGGQTVYARLEVGANAYILCGSLVPSRTIMSSFGADSAIVIFDTRGFGEAVSNKIPNVNVGFDGPCSYQGTRVIQRCDLGYHDVGPMSPVIDSTDLPVGAHQPDEHEKVFPLLHLIAGRDAYFLKEKRFLEQNEWRFVWLVEGVAADYIDIFVPEATKFCARWDELGDLIAF